MAKRTEVAASIRDVSKQVRWALFKVAFFSLFINLLALTLPLYMIQVFDRVIPTRHLETLFYLTLIAAAAITTCAVLEAVRLRGLIRIGNWSIDRLKPSILSACMRSRSRGIDVGRRPLDEAEALKSVLSSPAIVAVFDLPWFPLLIVVIWIVHPLLGIAATTASAVMIALTWLSDATTRKQGREFSHISAQGDRYANAVIQNAVSVVAMAMWPDVLRSWRQRGRSGDTRLGDPAEISATYSAVIKSIRMFIQVLILGLGAFLAVEGEISAGVVIAISLILGRALAPLDALVASWRQLARARDALQYLREFLNYGETANPGTALPAPQGAVAVQLATLALPGAKRALLNQVTFSLAPGETMAIIGPSGAGKSTLCKALLGYFPLTAGTIRIDGANVGDWRAEDLAPYIGYLPQRAEFLPGSIKENIARFQETADLPVIEAAQLAGVHELILSLPEGYDTSLQADGSPLSGGQQQRIGLARALFRKPRLLVLDEPNANLDGEGIEALFRILKAAREWGATIIMVAHTQRMTQGADKVLALREGRVEAFGQTGSVIERLFPVRQVG